MPFTRFLSAIFIGLLLVTTVAVGRNPAAARTWFIAFLLGTILIAGLILITLLIVAQQAAEEERRGPMADAGLLGGSTPAPVPPIGGDRPDRPARVPQPEPTPFPHDSGYALGRRIHPTH